MFKKALWIGLTLSVLGLVTVSSARADEWDKKTILTFSQPFEIPGHVLPAGTYMFKLNDTMSDRHVVQVFNADGSKIFATILAIPNYRLKVTDGTTIRFREMPAGQPEAIRAWFYPGRSVGEEFVYSKHRAKLLAKASKASVPAHAIVAEEAVTVEELKAAPIVDVTPEEKEEPVATVVRTKPVESTATTSAPAAEPAELPKTASTLPLIMLLGFASVGLALGLMAFGKRSSAL
jgi:hypothetical protein